VLVNVQVQTDHRLVHIDARPPAAALDELVADCVLGAQGRVLGVRDVRIADVAIDGNRVLGRQVLRPIDLAHGLVEFVRRSHLHFEDGPQHADGGTQPEVGQVKNGPVAVEVDAAAAGCDFGGTERAEFVRQYGFDPTATGGEKAFHGPG